MKQYYSMKENGSEADIYIYGDITSWEYFENDVSSYTLAKAIEVLDVERLNVYINSYGGEVAEGLAIYNALKRHKAFVRTVCDGFACSISSVIFMAGNERIMSGSSMLMIHLPWTYASGNAKELMKTAEDLNKIAIPAVNAYMEWATMTEDEIRSMLEEETYITPEEALSMGFATGITGNHISSHPNQSAQKTVYEMILRQRKEGKDLGEGKPKDQQEPINKMKHFLERLS